MVKFNWAVGKNTTTSVYWVFQNSTEDRIGSTLTKAVWVVFIYSDGKLQRCWAKVECVTNTSEIKDCHR